jgi:hypothetical protein
MSKYLWIGFFAVGILAAPRVAIANSPAPNTPCQGLEEGDTCGGGTYYQGTCYYDGNCLEHVTGDATDRCLYCPTADHKDDSSGCSMAGGANGLVLVFQVLLIALGGLWCWRRKKRNASRR